MSRECERERIAFCRGVSTRKLLTNSATLRWTTLQRSSSHITAKTHVDGVRAAVGLLRFLQGYKLQHTQSSTIGICLLIVVHKIRCQTRGFLHHSLRTSILALLPLRRLVWLGRVHILCQQRLLIAWEVRSVNRDSGTTSKMLWKRVVSACVVFEVQTAPLAGWANYQP